MRKPSIRVGDITRWETGDEYLVTPSIRYTHELQIQANQQKLSENAEVWRRPNLLTYQQWLLDAYRRLGDTHPELASKSVISDSTLLLIAQQRTPDWSNAEQHASMVCEAWSLVWEHNLWPDWNDAQSTDNGKLCADWFLRIQRYLQRNSQITIAEIPRVLINAISRSDWSPKPSVWIKGEEDGKTKRELMDTLEQKGLLEYVETVSQSLNSKCRVQRFESKPEELTSVAVWTREKLSQFGDTATIGIASDNPELTSKVLKRQFEGTFPEIESIDDLICVAKGHPFGESRLYKDCSTLLRWTYQEVSCSELFDLARSPYFPKLNLYENSRELKRESDREFKESLGIKEYCKLLETSRGSTLRNIEKNCTRRNRTPQPFVESVERLLLVIGEAGFSPTTVPQYSNLDTEQIDVFAEVLNQVTSQGSVFPNISWMGFVELFDLFANEQVVPVGTNEAPIQIMSRNATYKCQFDALWVLGMSDSEWPSSNRPNPFIPLSMQKAANLPRVTRKQMLQHDSQLTDWWFQCAEEVVFSYSNEDEDVQRKPSQLVMRKLVDNNSKAEADGTSLVSNKDWTRFPHIWSAQDNADEPYREYVQPATKRWEDRSKISTSALYDTAKCRFRSWAIHRANLAEDPETKSVFPGAKERGLLLHGILEELLQVGMTQASVLKLKDQPDAIDTAIQKTLRKQIKENEWSLSEYYIEQEVKRLNRLLDLFFDYEAQRDDFEVLDLEKKIQFEIFGLEVNGFIDRVDKLASGEKAILDYKTGKSYTPNNWSPDALSDAQLPMYGLADSSAEAMAFYKIHRDEKATRLQGTSKNAFSTEIKNGKPVSCATEGFKKVFDGYESYVGLREAWQQLFEKIVDDFLNGIADVAPVKPDVCNFCHLSNHCRIYETMRINSDEKEES